MAWLTEMGHDGFPMTFSRVLLGLLGGALIGAAIHYAPWAS